jgi:D-threo-aldose 1-dehydrogenase
MAQLSSGPAIARLVFGGASIGGLYEPVSEELARATLTAAWDAGVRAIDTAPHYGVGLSERRIGDFLAGRPRDEFTVSTKVGRLLVPAAGPVEGADGFYGTPAFSRVRDYSRDGVRRSVEESLARLRLDRIDLALIHDPDDHLPQAVDETYPALAELRDQGVVGAIGAGMNHADPLAWLITRTDLDCVMIAGRYTLLDQSAATSLFPLCLRRGVRVLAASVFNSGILAGGDRYSYAPAALEVLARVRHISEICSRYEIPVAAAALRYVLRHPAVSAAVVGARTPGEIRTDAGYLELDIPEALFVDLSPIQLPLLDGGKGVTRAGRLRICVQVEGVRLRVTRGGRGVGRDHLLDPRPRHPGSSPDRQTRQVRVAVSGADGDRRQLLRTASDVGDDLQPDPPRRAAADSDQAVQAGTGLRHSVQIVPRAVGGGLEQRAE